MILLDVETAHIGTKKNHQFSFTSLVYFQLLFLQTCRKPFLCFYVFKVFLCSYIFLSGNHLVLAVLENYIGTRHEYPSTHCSQCSHWHAVLYFLKISENHIAKHKMKIYYVFGKLLSHFLTPIGLCDTFIYIMSFAIRVEGGNPCFVRSVADFVLFDLTTSHGMFSIKLW